MGNSLCKDKSPRRKYVKKSPIDEVLANGYQPASNGAYSQNVSLIFNQISWFQSVPNLSTTNGNKLKTSTLLDARIFDIGKNQQPPVAPPRKKRNSTLKRSTLPAITINVNGNGVKNGFKDVFGKKKDGVRRLSYDDIEFIDKEDDEPQTRASIERQDSYERKLKIGNRKSDKFFGESLSDSLSDEPIYESKENLKMEKVTVEIETNPVQSQEWRHSQTFNSSLDQKAKFLMAMLDGEMSKKVAEEHKYRGQQPIEEPMFVARKKEIKRHICDDDDHMHNHHFHNHEKSESNVLSLNDEPDKGQSHIELGPRKPDRDFSKYQKQEEVEEMITNEINSEQELQAPMRIKKTVERESMPTPPLAPVAPETPKRKSGVIGTSSNSQPGTPTIKIDAPEFMTSTPIQEVTKIKKRPPPLLPLKSESPNKTSVLTPTSSPTSIRSNAPILTEDLMDKMIKKAYGIGNYHPEDFHEHNHDDGSNLVTPTSKLASRKTSVTRKISSESSPSSYGDSPATPKILIVSSTELFPPPLSPRVKKISFIDDPVDSTMTLVDDNKLKTESGKVEQAPKSPKSPMKTKNFEKLLNSSNLSNSMEDIIDEVYSKNSKIMQEFQSYLEQSIDEKSVIDVEAEKEFLNKKGNEYIYGPETNEAVKVVDVKMQVEEDDDDADNQSYSDSFESSDTEEAMNIDRSKIINKNLLPRKFNMRRESIEDVDKWFTNHLDLEEKKSSLQGSREGLTQGSPNYDMQKIFPFGRTITTRRDSMSDEFFSDIGKIPKPRFDSLRENDDTMSIPEDNEKHFKSADSGNSSTNDHSTLLKYFDKDFDVNEKKE
ncbi:unnamed protein product [Diamesa hyperborea]